MKKASQDRRLRRRFIAVFLGAVMLPSLILAYLGLRSLKQEEQWQEQLVLRGLKLTLAGTAQKVEADVDRTILQLLDSLTSETTLRVSSLPERLRKFILIHPLVEDVFVLDVGKRLLFPRTFRTQRPASSILDAGSSAPIRQRLIRGEEIEARGEFADAIDEFTAALNEYTSPRERLAILVRIARCRHKSGDLAGAQQDYRRVLAEDAHQFLGEELPYQIMASFQLAQILGQRGQPAQAFGSLARLYRNMLTEFQRFERSQFEFYLTKVRDDLRLYERHAGPNAPSLLDSLSLMEDLCRQESARGEMLRAHLVPPIEAAFLTSPNRTPLRYLSINNSDTLMRIAFRDLSERTRGIWIVGILLQRSDLDKFVANSLLGVDVGENLRVVLREGPANVEGAGGTLATPLAEEPLRLLAGTMTGYALALVGTQGTSVQEFITRSVTPYYALIFFVIVVISLGVIFIFHDISREQELARMKSDFISNVTHEIKTPIATIRSLSDNVNEGWVTSAEKQLHYFRLIARESERLGHLVQNTLDFSRIESGRKSYRMEQCDPKSLIEKTVERFRTLTEGQNVEISCVLGENLPPVSIDEDAIGQALLNLLDNAAKYSLERKIVILNAGVEGDRLKISVTDKGVGIDRRDIARVFEKFYRSESLAGRNVAGSGIGLTLVKEIVEAHGGSVSVQSKTNRGSTFTIFVPMVRRRTDAEDSVG